MLVVSCLCLTGRLGSPVFLCRTSRYYIAKCAMDNSDGIWLKLAAFYDTYCMRSSNDAHMDSKVGLDTLGVVDLDTSMMPDVFGLRAFDHREPVVRGLPDFAPIGPPGSLPVQSAILDTTSRDLSSIFQPMSPVNSGPLSPGPAQPVVMETSPVHSTLSSSIPMEVIDSPVEPLAPDVQNVCSPAIVSSNRRSLSPNSVQSDGSFYSATDSPTDQAPVIHYGHIPSIDPSVGKHILLRRAPTLGLGTTWGFVPTGSHPTGSLILLIMMDNLDYHFTSHGSWSGWEHRNRPVYWVGSQHMDPVPVPGADHSRRMTTTT